MTGCDPLGVIGLLIALPFILFLAGLIWLLDLVVRTSRSTNAEEAAWRRSVTRERRESGP